MNFQRCFKSTNWLAFLALFAGVHLTALSAQAGPSTNGLLLWLDSSDPGSLLTNAFGGVIAWTNKAPGATNVLSYTGNNDNDTSVSYNINAPTYVVGSNGFKVVNFNGNGYLDNLNFSSATPTDLTVFLLASGGVNPGNYPAFLAFNQSQATDDYVTGLNVDMGPRASANLNLLNYQGVKGGNNYSIDFINPLAFGTFHLFEIDYGGGPANYDSLDSLLVDGVLQIALRGYTNGVSLNNCYIGTRAYASGGDSTYNHDLTGQIAAVLVYDHQLTGSDLAQAQAYLNNFFAPPTPGIALTSTNSVVLSWPNTSAYHLQTSTSPLSSNWVNFSGLTSTNNNGTVTAIVMPPVGDVFFRLSRP